MDRNKTKAYKFSLTPNSCPINNSFIFLLYSSERLIAKQPGNSTKPLLYQQVKLYFQKHQILTKVNESQQNIHIT